VPRAGPGAGRWVATGTCVPVGSRQGGDCPPMNPPGTAAGTGVPGGLVCGGLSRRPPLPRRLRAGPAGLLSEAGRYVRGARPGCRAMGGDRNVRSGRKPTGGRLPPYEPPGEDPALACRVAWFVGGSAAAPHSPRGSVPDRRASCQRLEGMFAGRDQGAGRWVATGTCVPVGSRQGGDCPPMNPPGRTRHWRAGRKTAGACWG